MISAQVRFDKTIHSKENSVYTELLQCQKTKGIKKFGFFMVCGFRAVLDCLSAHPHLAHNLIFPDDFGLSDEKQSTTILLKATPLKSQGLSFIALARPLFKELDLFGTNAPLLVLHVPEIPSYELANLSGGLEILCALGDPANVGALLRSAAAFGASRVILLKESASPFHPKAVRAASAATLTTPLFEGPSIQELKRIAEESEISALDMGGAPIHRLHWSRDVKILIGEEGQGVPRGDFRRISIPISSGVESLNATVAASIALYSYRSYFDLNAET